MQRVAERDPQPGAHQGRQRLHLSGVGRDVGAVQRSQRRVRDVLREVAPSRLLKTVPNTATPIDPPIERAKVASDVATPSSEYWTEFWAASTSTCIVRPMPAAEQRHVDGDCQNGVVTPMR